MITIAPHFFPSPTASQVTSLTTLPPNEGDVTDDLLKKRRTFSPFTNKVWE
jgi:hypothetical protein